jgi:hypothetical protein
MAKKTSTDYLLLFRGGCSPDEMTPEQCQATMGNWMAWMGGLKKKKQLLGGSPLQDGGKVLSGPKGKTVSPFRDSEDAVGGYLLIKARNIAEATKISQGCPIFNNGGTVELRAIQEM